MIGSVMTPFHYDYSAIVDEETADKLVKEECVILTGFAKELVPVDKGQLKNSIMWKTQKDEGGFNKEGVKEAPSDTKLSKPQADEGYVGSGLEYAGPVEYGRKDMPNYPRQPYLRPAIDYSKKEREARRKKTIGISIKEAYNQRPTNG